MMSRRAGDGAREYKAIKATVMGIDGRTVTGIFAVHGNVDEGGDRSHPGLVGDGTVDGRRRTVFLWQHQSTDPPIATIDRIFEVAQIDLPPAVKLYAPVASGGVAVTRTYLETPRGDEVLAGVKSGAITEMSYAFDLTRWDFEDQGDGMRPIRNLYQAELYDISDVNWGMNPATSADGQKDWKVRPFVEHSDAVEAVLAEYGARVRELKDRHVKEGRVLSGENRKRIESTIEALNGATEALKSLLAASEPQKDGGHQDTNALRAAWSRQQQRLRELGVFL